MKRNEALLHNGCVDVRKKESAYGMQSLAVNMGYVLMAGFQCCDPGFKPKSLDSFLPMK